MGLKQDISWLTLSGPVVALCATSFNKRKFYILTTQCIYMLCVWISEQTVIFAQYSTKTVGECGTLQLFGQPDNKWCKMYTEIKARISMSKAAFNNKKNILFTRKLDLNLRKILVMCYIWRWNLDTSESRSQLPGKAWNVVLEKDGEDRER